MNTSQMIEACNSAETTNGPDAWRVYDAAIAEAEATWRRDRTAIIAREMPSQSRTIRINALDTAKRASRIQADMSFTVTMRAAILAAAKK